MNRQDGEQAGRLTEFPHSSGFSKGQQMAFFVASTRYE
jgi:hypothetical protein